MAGPAARRERLLALIRHAIDPDRALRFGAGDEPSVAVIEGGDPLGAQPMVAHAMASLRNLTSPADFAELSEWLRAPYWTLPASASRSRLDQWLHQHGTLELDPARLRALLARAPGVHEAAARELLARIEDASRILGQDSALPQEWSERIHASLQVLGWPGERIRDSDEQQTYERFIELLKEFGALGTATGPLSRTDAVRVLGELIGRTPFRPASGDAPITLSASLMDPIVRYDGIWVAGLDADSWPQPARPDPFLPLHAQVAARVPEASPEGRLRQARFLMTAWAAASREVILSSAAHADDRELLPSRLLSQFDDRAAAPLESAPNASKGEVWLPARLRREGQTRPFTDDAGLAWPIESALPGGTQSLHLQNECPFRAYAQLRLGCVPAEFPEPGIGPDQRGRLLHGALEKVWHRLGDQHALLSLDRGQLNSLINVCVTECAAELWGAQRETPEHERELRRAARLIVALCEVERERSPFRVEQVELDMDLRIAGAQLGLRIDRLDALDEGGHAILDYKSGRKRGTAAINWHGDRPAHVQLLAYREAIGGDVRAMANVHVVAGRAVFDGVADSAGLLPKVKPVDAQHGRGSWAECISDWRAHLERLAGNFLAGRAEVDPLPQACRYCHLQSLCRISDIARDEEEELGDE
jgi:probable DNA repair protein